MKSPSFSMIQREISQRLNETFHILHEIGYDLETCSVREFYDYMTGEIFSEDEITLKAVLENKYLMIHEVVEISELKKMGLSIDTRVIVDSRKEVIYSAHLYAMDFELCCIQSDNDHEWLKKRIDAHYRVLTSDPWLPVSLKPRAQEIWDKFKHYTA